MSVEGTETNMHLLILLVVVQMGLVEVITNDVSCQYKLVGLFFFFFVCWLSVILVTTEDKTTKVEPASLSLLPSAADAVAVVGSGSMVVVVVVVMIVEVVEVAVAVLVSGDSGCSVITAVVVVVVVVVVIAEVVEVAVAVLVSGDSGCSAITAVMVVVVAELVRGDVWCNGQRVCFPSLPPMLLYGFESLLDLRALVRGIF